MQLVCIPVFRIASDCLPSETKIDEGDESDVSTVTAIELAELFVKNNIFNFNEKYFKQKEAKHLRKRDSVETLIEIHARIKSREANKLFGCFGFYDRRPN